MILHKKDVVLVYLSGSNLYKAQRKLRNDLVPLDLSNTGWNLFLVVFPIWEFESLDNLRDIYMKCIHNFSIGCSIQQCNNFEFRKIIPNSWEPFCYKMAKIMYLQKCQSKIVKIIQRVPSCKPIFRILLWWIKL